MMELHEWNDETMMESKETMMESALSFWAFYIFFLRQIGDDDEIKRYNIEI